jgi:lipoprotein NlpD
LWNLRLVSVLLLWVLIITGCRGTPEVAGPSSTLPPGRFELYEAKKGDTLASIGRRYGVDWKQIVEYNSVAADNLQIGQVLVIPLEEAASSSLSVPSSVTAVLSAGLRDVSLASLNKGKPSHPFWWPTDGRLARRYEDQVGGFSEPGIGISAPVGTEVCAVADGNVISCTEVSRPDKSGWGMVVIIRHAGGLVSWYGCLGRILVKEKQAVRKGQRIGTVGTNAITATPELAIRFYKDERPVDPLKYLP